MRLDRLSPRFDMAKGIKNSTLSSMPAPRLPVLPFWDYHLSGIHPCLCLRVILAGGRL